MRRFTHGLQNPTFHIVLPLKSIYELGATSQVRHQGAPPENGYSVRWVAFYSFVYRKNVASISGTTKQQSQKLHQIHSEDKES